MRLTDRERCQWSYKTHFLLAVSHHQANRPPGMQAARRLTYIGFTDHQSVLGFLRHQNLNDKLARWYTRIMEFQPFIEFEYVPGKFNRVADALSRHPVGAVLQETIEFDNKSLREHQHKDALLQPIIHILESCDAYDGPELPLNIKQFSMENGILYRNLTKREAEIKQAVTPQTLITSVLTLYHNTEGHQLHSKKKKKKTLFTHKTGTNKKTLFPHNTGTNKKLCSLTRQGITNILPHRQNITKLNKNEKSRPHTGYITKQNKNNQSHPHKGHTIKY